MHKLPTKIQSILKTINHCANDYNIQMFLYGNVVLYASKGESALLYKNQLDIIFSYESEFDTNKLYKCLIEHVSISREIENSPLQYQFVSDDYQINIKLIQKFDPTLIDHVKDLGRFSTELLFFDFNSEKITHLESIDPNVLHNINPISSWEFEDVLGFVAWKGMLPDLTISTNEYDHLRLTSLGSLKESMDIGWNRQIQNILLTRRSGAALKFMSNVFTDGMSWSFKSLVDYMISLNVGINEESNIETVFNDKKFEIIDLYNEFFLDDKKTQETDTEIHHRLSTSLKLLFDSPNLDIPRAYINTSNIAIMADCGTNGVGTQPDGTANSSCRVQLTTNDFFDPNTAQPQRTIVGCNPHVSETCCSQLEVELQEITDAQNKDFVWETFWSSTASGWGELRTQCGLGDPPIFGTDSVTSDFCPYGNCSECKPLDCEGPKCCCCVSEDIVRPIRPRCYDQVYYSCNREGDGPQQGVFFDPSCTDCFEACDFALGEGSNTCADISGHGGFAPPDWWNFGSTIGPCECNCAELDNPSDPNSSCNLTCVTCRGLSSNSFVEVNASNCSYQISLSPGLSTCNLDPFMDVVFVVDFSWLTASTIENTKDNIEKFSGIMSSISSTRTRMGLVAYGVDNDPDFFEEQIFANGEILTEDPDEIRTVLDSFSVPPVVAGATKWYSTLSAGGVALFTYPWEGVTNILFTMNTFPKNQNSQIENYINPVRGSFSAPGFQPSPRQITQLANELGVSQAWALPDYVIGGSSGFDPVFSLIPTYYNQVDISADFDDSIPLLVENLGITIFPSSCNCVDTTPVPIKWCSAGVGLNGECVGETTDIPIRKCADGSDCGCNEPMSLEVCGEIILIEPDESTTNLICCGEIEGGGCSCSDITTSATNIAACCGISCNSIDVCNDFVTVEDAIDAIWCECWINAKEGSGEGTFILVDPLGCSRCTVPDVDDPEWDTIDLNAVINCELRISDGTGGFISKTRPEIVAEVTTAWNACERTGAPGDEVASPGDGDQDEEDIEDEREPPAPLSASEDANCLPECNRTDECISGSMTCASRDDIRTCRENECATSNSGCVSIRNPDTAILNNGIGLVAYESMDDISVIKIDQFNTSVPAKILPNRRTNYGRLEHSSKWGVDDENTTTNSRVAKLYYFETLSSSFIQGTSGTSNPGVLVDIVVFRNGPLQNQCFPLRDTTATTSLLGEDEFGTFIRLTIPDPYVLSNEFPSLDDVYDIEWFIINSDDKGLTGNAGKSADTSVPGFDYFLEDVGQPNSGANKINEHLKLPPHIHDGASVPVANPSLAVAHNYMNAAENSHFVYLSYQALEDSKWNIYLRQIRLSEFSKEKQVDNIVSNTTTLEPLSGLSVNELTYRVICTNDDCSMFGNEFIAKRSVTLEVVLPDGREVFNQAFVDSNSTESWDICPGLPAGDTTKKKVFAELAHSAVVSRCPDQFEFNDIFYNWDVGDEFPVPFKELSSDDLFFLLKKQNDSSIDISEDSQVVSGITISSSQAGAVWYDSILEAWSAPTDAVLQDLLQFKGRDLSAPIPLTEFENGHCTHPVVKVNNNNEVYVVYECTDPQLHQIHMVGTAMPTSSLPVGILIPKNIDANLDYFLAPDDFVYREIITSSSQKINQLPDMHIDVNDVVHISWQSNRDNYWEIYYAKSDDLFTQTRITEFKSKSLRPSISGDDKGNVHIVWHDNRFGNWEILMAFRDDGRIKPLYEQDPYLASLRNDGYNHSSDLIPLILTNNSSVDSLCIFNLSVKFFKDRLLTNEAFTVKQADFPSAFQVSGLDVENTTTGGDLTTTSWNNVQSQFIEYSSGHFVPSERSIDTGLVGSSFETVTINFTDIPSAIRFMASEFADEFEELASLQADAIAAGEDPNLLTVNDTQWLIVSNILPVSGSNVGWSSPTGAGMVSGVSIDIDTLLEFPFRPPDEFTLPVGRYKRVEVFNLSGPDFSTVTSITIGSILKNRICVSPGQTATVANLDLTPSIRIDKEGNETIEMPLPIDARKNKTYFIQVSGVNDLNQTVVFQDQKRSVSCETCAPSTSSWESTSCSFNINFDNTGNGIMFYNARIRFYADQEKKDLVSQFNAFNDGELECFTTDDNQQAQLVWQSAGYEVATNKQRTVILWPLLSDSSGLLCGIKYWVETEICSGTTNSPCSKTDVVSAGFVSWTCDCSSKRWTEQFGNAPENIRELVKWNSSGDGFSDVRLTETGSSINNYNPQIHIRSNLTGIVIFETDREKNIGCTISSDGTDECPVDFECVSGVCRRISGENIHSIYATAFKVFPSSVMYASGAESIITNFEDILIQSDIPVSPCSGVGCDDCTDSDESCVAIQGRNVSFSLDQYDNIFVAAEQQNDQSQCEETIDGKQQSVIVHRCGIQPQNLAFIPKELSEDNASTVACDASEILGKAAPLSQDQIFRRIIRTARVSNKFAKYHIVRFNKPSAVVDQCDIIIDIITEPETVAVRLKNENESWSNWYPFDPEVGEYTISVPWTLSPGSGLKAVTIEAAAYQGLSTSFTLIIIADYKGTDHIIEFFKDKSSSALVPGKQTSNSQLLGFLVDNRVDDDIIVDENKLSQLDGVPVAGIRNTAVTVGEIANSTGEFIYIKISVSESYLSSIKDSSGVIVNDNLPTFDVLQQGDEDFFSLPTVFEGGAFFGVFPIKKDNKSFFKDGLSFIIPHFFNDCSDVSVSTDTGSHIRDRFNVPIPTGATIPGTTTPSVDKWENERNELGEVQHKIDIRGIDDPHFIFGDPNYSLKKQEKGPNKEQNE